MSIQQVGRMQVRSAGILGGLRDDPGLTSYAVEIR